MHDLPITDVAEDHLGIMLEFILRKTCNSVKLARQASQPKTEDDKMRGQNISLDIKYNETDR